MTKPAAPRRHYYGCCFVATIHIHVSHLLSLLLTPVTPLPCLFCRHRRCHGISFSLHGAAASHRTAYHADPPRCSTTWRCSGSVVAVRVWLWVVLLSGVL